MIALARSEVLKIRTTRGWWAYLIVIVLLTGIAVAGDTGTAVDADRSQLEFQLGLVEAAGFAALLALILGITIVTTEFRHGTVTPTFLAAPRREQVLGSKTIAGSIVAVLFGLLALLVVAAVGLPWLSILDVDGAVPYLPFRALDGADGTGGENLLSYWSAVAVSLGWVALLGAAGVWRTRRRDIT